MVVTLTCCTTSCLWNDGDLPPRRWGERATVTHAAQPPSQQFCTKPGSGVSHPNVSLTVATKAQTVRQTTTVGEGQLSLSLSDTVSL